MKNFKLVLFSEKEKQDLIKGCLYLDIDLQDCIIDICTTSDKGGCTGLDVCNIDSSDSSCSYEDICGTDNSEGECLVDSCVTDNTDGNCSMSDPCYTDNTGGNCSYDQCVND